MNDRHRQSPPNGSDRELRQMLTIEHQAITRRAMTIKHRIRELAAELATLERRLVQIAELLDELGGETELRG